MRRLLLILACVLVFVVIAVPAVIIWSAVHTQSGLQFVARHVPHHIGGVRLDITGVSGTLASGVHVDRVEIDQLEGRVTSVLLTPYPPGIPLLIPGERFNRTIVQFLQFARNFNQQFPGFDTDIQGLVETSDAGKLRYYVDCVRPK